MYTKTSWVARVGTALNRFLKTNESAGSVELTNDPTGVTTAGTPFTVANMNKIEEGIYDAHVTADNHIANTSNPHAVTKEQVTGLKATDSPTFASVNTGHGTNELYAMNQNVRTTDQVTFATVNTGQGNNELYGMNQGVKTTDSPTFASVNTTNGPNKPVDNNDASMPSVGIGGFSYAHHTQTVVSQYPSITIGSGGTWVYVAHSGREGSPGNTIVEVGRVAGGSSVTGLNITSSDFHGSLYVIAWRIA